MEPMNEASWRVISSLIVRWRLHWLGDAEPVCCASSVPTLAVCTSSNPPLRESPDRRVFCGRIGLSRYGCWPGHVGLYSVELGPLILCTGRPAPCSVEPQIPTRRADDPRRRRDPLSPTSPAPQFPEKEQFWRPHCGGPKLTGGHHSPPNTPSFSSLQTPALSLSQPTDKPNLNRTSCEGRFADNTSWKTTLPRQSLS